MPYLKGLRVVRGPDWKWGDQDGGAGHVGTVMDSSFFGRYGAKTITVLWDTGFRGQYRGGPGSYDLRVTFNISFSHFLKCNQHYLISSPHR